VTSGSESLPYLSRLRARLPKDAPLSSVTRLGLELLEEKRWSLLRSTEPGSVSDMAFHEMRYAALKHALLVLLEAQELHQLEPPDGRTAAWLADGLASVRRPEIDQAP